jgi:peptidoglycan-associated lipoprotein
MKGGETYMFRQKNLMVIALIVFCSISMILSTSCKKKVQVKDEAAEPSVKDEKVDSTGSTGEAQPPAGENTTEGTGILNDFESIYFEFDKYDLKSDARETLAKTLEALKANPNTKIQIEGNCDERGTTEYNLQLGNRRAESAKSYLVAGGLDASRITTISYGEEKPLATGNDEESWAKNRRDDFKIVSK